MRYRLDIQSPDEIGVLGQTFNSMADSIEQAIVKLEKSKSTTEDSNVTLRAMLSKVIDSMPSIIIGIDTQTRVTLWNDEACKITGQSFEQVEGRVLFEVFPLLKKEKSIVFPAIEQGQIKKEEKLEIVTDNERIFYDVTVYPLINGKIDGAVLRIDNITTRVHMEEVMLQSEKMLSVGGLAAGMAHEINNPLAGVMYSADLMQRRLTDIKMPANIRTAEEIGISIEDIKAFMGKRGILRMITTINESGRRMAAIVDNMLSFARKTDTLVSSHNPVELLDNIIELAATDYDLKRQYDFKTIEIVKKYEEKLPMLPCEVAKIQQVLLNILRNGAQAMGDNSEKKPKFILRLSKETKTNMLCIEIEDNGPGMSEAIRKRIFEPFFTTKSAGVGTGLGLSVSYFIITENHEGTMDVISEPGKGVTFIIRLPLEEKK